MPTVSEKVKGIRAGSGRVNDWKYWLFVIPGVWDSASRLQNGLVIEHEMNKSIYMCDLIECLLFIILEGVIWRGWSKNKTLGLVPITLPLATRVCSFQEPRAAHGGGNVHLFKHLNTLAGLSPPPVEDIC